jgi:tetratricopeptide (TPR) repeat protein
MVGPHHRRVDPTTQVDHETDEPDDGSKPDWLARGETIGRYVVHECLGAGGMGVIYSAWDPELDRKLAIKVVRGRNGRLGSTRGRARLLREGQALARLRHPNVITVHDVGTHEGQVFVAMEFVEGRTLHDRLLQGPRPPVGEIVDVFLQIGRGLAAAHRAGLVHRDVKPENVMIGDDGRVLVLDFGIARDDLGPDSEVVDEPARESVGEPEPEDGTRDETAVAGVVSSEVVDDHSPFASLTRAGAIVGTPAYMSPEQHRGLHVDARSDQFSFCVAMWEALNGERPYGEGSRQKLLARMRLGHIRPFSNREVPRRVGAALRRGLAWNPDERHESMEKLLEGLNPRGRAVELPKWRAVAIGSVGGLLIGIAGTAALLGRDASPERETPSCARAGLELVAVWNAERSATIARSFDATGLERGSPSWVRTHDHLDGWAKRWTAAREQACAAHYIDHRDSAATHDQRLACLAQQRQHFDELLALLEHADAAIIDGAVTTAVQLPPPELCAEAEHLRELQQGMPEPDSPAARQRLAELRAELSRLQLRAEFGRWREELEHSRQLAAAAREARHPPLLARVLLVHAAYLEHADESAEAEALLLEAAGLAAIAGDEPTQVRALIEAARHISASGRHDEAMRWLVFAEAVASTTTDRPTLTVAIADARATIVAHAGDLEGAREGLRATVAQLDRAGDPTLALPGVLHHLARIESDLGDEREATALLRRALVLDEQAHGPTHAHVAAIRRDLARVLERRGERQAALGEYERALSIYEQIHGPSRETAAVRTDYGTALARAGRCAEAWDPLGRAIVEARAHAPDSLLLASSLQALARACESSHADAIAHAREATALRERLQGPTHPDVREALAIEALSLVANDQPTRALAQIERAIDQLEDPQTGRESGLLLAAHGLTLAALGRADLARRQLELARPLLAGDGELGPRVEQALTGLSPD